MKIYTYALLILALDSANFIAEGQNLVPNPSFENYNSCPSGLSGISYSSNYSLFPTVAGWVDATSGSPDYFNSCAAGLSIGVPYNFCGYRPPHSGNAYTGMVVYQNSNYFREYIECKLSQSMVAGHQYHLQFYCAPGGSYVANNYSTIVGIDKIGAVVSDTEIAETATPSLYMNPTIASPAGLPITDTINWTRVQGKYSANGGEQWLTIGHFNDGLPVIYSTINQGTVAGVTFSYYFVDDVALRDMAHPDSTRDTTFCTQSTLVTMHGRPGADEYEWNTGSTADSIQVVPPGIWWVRSWKDTFYFVDTFHIGIGTSLPLHLPNDTAVCNGVSLTIGANNVYSTYAWNTGASTPSITINQPGIYILTVSDACSTQKDTVVVHGSPQLHLPNDTVLCYGRVITVSANHNYASYSWNTGATTPSITIRQSGTYILSVQDSCLQKDSINVIVRPATHEPVAGDTTICKSVQAVFVNAVGDSLRWYTSAGSAGTYTRPSVTVSATGIQIIYVTQTQNGCESDKKAITINVITVPVVDLGNDTTVCRGVGLLLGTSDPNTNWQWNTGATYCPIVVRETGYYLLTGTNKCGHASDAIAVTFADCDSSGMNGYPAISHDCIFTPTGFTPNSDGLNDFFKVFTRCQLAEYHISIYNRWGQRIYEGTDLARAWDGTFKGLPVPAGTYNFYVDYLVANSGNVHDNVKGEVTVIR